MAKTPSLETIVQCPFHPFHFHFVSSIVDLLAKNPSGHFLVTLNQFPFLQMSAGLEPISGDFPRGNYHPSAIIDLQKGERGMNPFGLEANFPHWADDQMCCAKKKRSPSIDVFVGWIWTHLFLLLLFPIQCKLLHIPFQCACPHPPSSSFVHLFDRSFLHLFQSIHINVLPPIYLVVDSLLRASEFVCSKIWPYSLLHLPLPPFFWLNPFFNFGQQQNAPFLWQLFK